MPKSMTIAELRKQLAAKESQLTKLLGRRGEIVAQLAAVDGDIEALGGEVPKGNGRRKRKVAKAAKAPKVAKAPKAAPVGRPRKLPKNPKPLIEFAKDVLAKAKDGLRVKAVEAAIKKAGYKTFSKDFYGVVATALREGPFDKVSRGVYKLKAAKKAAK